jgi:hypothetical protein
MIKLYLVLINNFKKSKNQNFNGMKLITLNIGISMVSCACLYSDDMIILTDKKNVNKQREFTLIEKASASIQDIIPKLHKINLPYTQFFDKQEEVNKESLFDKDRTDEQYLKVSEEDMLMLNDITQSRTFNINEDYYYARYIDFETNDYWGISFIYVPEYSELGGLKEFLLVFCKDDFMTSHNLYKDEGIFGVTNASLFVYRNRICIKYESYHFYRDAGYFHPEECKLSFHVLNEANKFEVTDAIEIYGDDSFDYFMTLSKQRKEIPICFLDNIRMYKDNTVSENIVYNKEKLTIKSVCHFHLNKEVNAFIYWLKDDVQNTFIYNEFNNNGELIRCSLVESCKGSLCTDFKISSLIIEGSKWCEIQSNYSPGNFKQYTYYSVKGTKFSTNENDYIQYKDTDFADFFYRMADDFEIRSMCMYNDVSQLKLRLKSEVKTNEALVKNINRLEK